MSKKEASSKAKGKKTKKRTSKWHILDRIVIVFLVLVLLGGISGISIIGYIIATTDTHDMLTKMSNKEPTTFYDDESMVFGELGAESRQNVTYKQIPQSVIDAFLSIEDSRFYTHNGFDLPRFISSAFSNLKSGDLAQGGSTLTMQTIDNFFTKPEEEAMKKQGKKLNPIQKIENKMKEIYLSIHLETKLSKPQIMEKYLNQINFGDQARGIERGAQHFFGKDVEDLNLSEAAYLAGCINAPNTFNPYNGYDSKHKINYYKAATKRRDETLAMMLYHGYITKREYELAKSTKLAFEVNGKDTLDQDPYHDYMLAARDEAMHITGKDPATTPMKIYTNLDRKAQDEANKIAHGDVVNLNTNRNYQIATTLINNKTGGISAMIPGRSDTKGIYRNRADSIDHMPGSSIKPLIDYAYALDQLGYCTSHVYDDRPIRVDGSVIRNSDGRYYGKVSMERALAQSLNTPAIATLQDAIKRKGNDAIIKYLSSMGFSKSELKQFNVRYAIGGTISTSPQQMAAAFAVLANAGQYREPHYVTRIEFKDGKTSPISVTPKTNQVMSPQAAYMTSDLLYKAINGKYKGWNLMGRLGFGAYPVYGKTGTSDWKDDGLSKGIPLTAPKDEWMINYTSEYSIATWSGFDQQVADGNNYVDEKLLYENIPGWVNKHMLDTVSKHPIHIQKPDGISSYGGGMIKTQFLKDAAKNNPMTEQDQISAMDKLKELYTNVNGYPASNYTSDSYQAFKANVDAAKKMIDENTASEDEVNNMLQKLQESSDALIPFVNKDGLVNSIHRAASLNLTNYTDASYSNLVAVVSTAKSVLTKRDVTQQEIDAQITLINNAIAALAPRVNNTVLYNTIQQAQAVWASLASTSPNKAQLLSAINAARSVYNNPNATQQQVDSQVAALQAILSVL